MLLLNYKISTRIKFFLCTLTLTLLFCNSVKASSIIENTRKNTLYKKIINYTLPLIKVTSSEEGLINLNQSSIKSIVLEVLGISLENPYSILGREVCYLKGVSTENSEGHQGENISFNPFKLEENDIKMQEKNLPNKDVVIDNPDLKNNAPSIKPEVFIYQSHNSEGYGLGGVNDTWDNSKNIMGVGEALTTELQVKYGISVVHDETVHNLPDYKNSYGKSAQTIDKYLKSFGDFKLVIDLHRDSSINRIPVITKLNGETVARYEFVMCKSNPHFSKNMEAVNKLISISEKLFPGLLRSGAETKGVYYYNTGTRYFNQDKSNNAMLIEVGSNMNSPGEARATAKYLARIIAEYLNGKN